MSMVAQELDQWFQLAGMDETSFCRPYDRNDNQRAVVL